MIPKRITVHCSDSPNGKPVSVEEITRWHVARGWKTIGYHMVIEPDGQVFNGRGLNEQGAGVEGENEDNIHICLIGDTLFTREQFVALRYKLDSLFLTYSIPKWAIYGHYQFPSAIKQGKTCPNIEINRLLFWYLHNDDSAVAKYVFQSHL